MIGQGNDIQVSTMLNIMENLLKCRHAITISAVHMQVSPAQLAGNMGLLLGHLFAFVEHRGTCTGSFKAILHHIVFARDHVAP